MAISNHDHRELDRARLPDHRDRLRVALSLTGSRHDAEDLVQETYLRVLRRPRRLRAGDDLGYLLRTMRNAWLNHLRGRGAEAAAMRKAAAALEREPARDPLLGLQAQALLEAVAALPPRHRDTIAAVDLLGLSYRDAARALGTREGTIMSRLSRARTRVVNSFSA
jgi:RNA polymerase sigma-70 factor (ECF subfamily)